MLKRVATPLVACMWRIHGEKGGAPVALLRLLAEKVLSIVSPRLSARLHR